jgi:hypothetical protein
MSMGPVASCRPVGRVHAAISRGNPLCAVNRLDLQVDVLCPVAIHQGSRRQSRFGKAYHPGIARILALSALRLAVVVSCRYGGRVPPGGGVEIFARIAMMRD